MIPPGGSIPKAKRIPPGIKTYRKKQEVKARLSRAREIKKLKTSSPEEFKKARQNPIAARIARQVHQQDIIDSRDSPRRNAAKNAHFEIVNSRHSEEQQCNAIENDTLGNSATHSRILNGPAFVETEDVQSTSYSATDSTSYEDMPSPEEMEILDSSALSTNLPDTPAPAAVHVMPAQQYDTNVPDRACSGVMRKCALLFLQWKPLPGSLCFWCSPETVMDEDKP